MTIYENGTFRTVRNGRIAAWALVIWAVLAIAGLAALISDASALETCQARASFDTCHSAVVG